MQHTTDDSVVSMQAVSSELTMGASQAQQSTKALDEILAAARSFTGQVAEITRATEQMRDLSNNLVLSTHAVSRVVDGNLAATRQMNTDAIEVTQSIENIASVSQQNSAAVEEVSASAEEMSAQVDKVSVSARSLAGMAQTLQQLIARFKLAARYLCRE